MDIIRSLNSNIREKIIVYSTGLLITALAGLFFYIVGYPRVVTANETLELIAPPIYMIPIFLPYGILIGELIWSLMIKVDPKILILFFIECTIVAVLSLFRYVLGIQYSGHTLILAFYIIHQIITNKNQYPLRILIGFLVLFITIIYKIIFWNDPITFSFGLILGIAIWLPGYIYRMKYYKK
ncbi:MAG: hypothetical protein ACFFAH_14405 [Promethearchaeota archaeon]